MASHGVSRRERKKLTTRKSLVQTARLLFDKNGIDRTSLDEVADAADVSRSTLFNYFPTKEALLGEIALEDVQALEQAIRVESDAEPSPLARIRHIMRLFIANGQPSLSVTRRVLLENLIHPSGIPDSIARMESMLTDIVRQAQMVREVDPKHDPTVVTRAIVGLYLAAFAFAQWRSTSQEENPLAPNETDAMLVILSSGIGASGTGNEKS